MADCYYKERQVLQSVAVITKSDITEDLVQKLFLKLLERWLTSETKVTEVKPLLRNPSVSDEDLIFAVG